MVKFELKIVNAKQVRFAFGGMAAAVKDWRKYIWPGVTKDALRPWLKKQFEEQGHGDHGRWKELSGPYATRKARRYPGEKILSASGKMKRDLLAESNRGEMTARTLLYGTDIKYARYHQTGTKKMPARRIFDPEEGDAKGTMPNMIRLAVSRGVKLAGNRYGFGVADKGTNISDVLRSARSSMRTKGSSVAGGM